jgi:predicted lactoylglutathione lyase
MILVVFVQRNSATNTKSKLRQLIFNNMAKQIFINLAVKDLQKSMDFYTALGFSNNPQFSDDTGKCMVWSENIFVMIMTHEKFTTFATKPIADTKSNLAGLFSLSVDSVDEVNSILRKGLDAGGTEPTEMKDYGFMQQRTIEDFDGHTWEVFYMDITKFPQQS